MYKKVSFLLLFATFSIALAKFRTQKQDLVCFEEGECIQSPFLGITFEQNEDDCLKHCQTILNCTWFTFDRKENSCETFTNCTNLSTEKCHSCVSGERECQSKICDASGVCQVKEKVNTYLIFTNFLEDA